LFATEELYLISLIAINKNLSKTSTADGFFDNSNILLFLNVVHQNAQKTLLK
jgi:hypothetical protein